MVARLRFLVLLVALVALAGKLYIAATTYGTNDVFHWTEFAGGVRRVGPIAVYREHFTSVFDMPPPIPFLLMGLNWLTSLGIPFRFLIRVPACLADVGSALLVFELLRVRRSERSAAMIAVLVALSPVLVVISGFHGNTDPVLVFLVLLSFYLLVDRGAPALAGVAFGLSIGIKLVPIVALPVMLASIRKPREFLRFASALGATVLVTWTPTLLREFSAVRTNVFEYSGYLPLRTRWGLVLFLRSLGSPAAVLTFVVGPGRFLILMACSLFPAYLVWRHPDRALEGLALCMPLFLLLSPAFGTQYLAWAVVFVYLLEPWTGTAYGLAAGVLLIWTYTKWSGGFPWYQAHARPLDNIGVALGVLTWIALLVCLIAGVRIIRGTYQPAHAEGDARHHGALTDGSNGDPSLSSRRASRSRLATDRQASRAERTAPDR